MKNVIPSILRALALSTALAFVVLGGTLVWYFRADARLRSDLARLETRMRAEIAVREAMIARLSRSTRKARVEVIAQERGERGHASQRDGTHIVSTTIRFIEVDDDGRELGRRDITVPGDTVFIDAWTARFPKEVVAEGNPLRDRTLVLLRRVYSDLVPPSLGTPLDTPGSIPLGYAGSDKARLEQAVWKGFWKIASDPDAAAAHGVAVAQGEAVYKPMRAGESYDLFVDAAAGLTLVPASPRRAKAE